MLSAETSTPQKSVVKWSNRENAKFYRCVSVARLQHFAKSAGLNTLIDVQIILQLIRPPLDAKILDVGAGYGRAAKALHTKGYTDITAFEVSPTYLPELHKIPGLKIQKQNLLMAKPWLPHHSFALIIWLFSGITDFSQQEQLLVFHMLVAALDPEGCIVVDLPDVSSNNADTQHGQQHIISSTKEYSQYVGYLPTATELLLMAATHKLKMRALPYATQTGRRRFLYFFFGPKYLTTKVGAAFINREERRDVFYDAQIAATKNSASYPSTP